MRAKIIIITVLLNLLAVNICWPNQQIETQIGPFILSDTSVPESSIVSQFGEGYVDLMKVGNKVLGKKRIYYVPNQRVWIEISFSHVLSSDHERIVESVLVTKKKLCDKKYVSKKSFEPLVTSRGIGLNDSIDKVINAYGNPSVSIEIEAGKVAAFSAIGDELKYHSGRILRYFSDKENILNFAEFYFSGKELHSILISASE